MNWSKMEFEFVEQASCFCWIEILVEGFRLVRVQIVEDHPDAVSIRVVLINEVFHEQYPVFSRPLIFDGDSSPTDQWFGCEEQILCFLWFVVIVFARDRARFGRARLAEVFDQLCGMFVETDDRVVRIIRFAVQCENVFHVVDELGALAGRNHPLLGSVRLQLVFF